LTKGHEGRSLFRVAARSGEVSDDDDDEHDECDDMGSMTKVAGSEGSEAMEIHGEPWLSMANRGKPWLPDG
jgi:hypothetical protein